MYLCSIIIIIITTSLRLPPLTFRVKVASAKDCVPSNIQKVDPATAILSWIMPCLQVEWDILRNPQSTLNTFPEYQPKIWTYGKDAASERSSASRVCAYLPALLTPKVKEGKALIKLSHRACIPSSGGSHLCKNKSVSKVYFSYS